MAPRIRRLAAFLIAYWTVGPFLARDAAEGSDDLGWLALVNLAIPRRVRSDDTRPPGERR